MSKKTLLLVLAELAVVIGIITGFLLGAKSEQITGCLLLLLCAAAVYTGGGGNRA